MATFRPDELIGKTLIAKKDIVAFRDLPNCKLSIPFKNGKVIGTITGWKLNPENKNSLYWIVSDIYVLHNVNYLTING